MSKKTGNKRNLVGDNSGYNKAGKKELPVLVGGIKYQIAHYKKGGKKLQYIFTIKTSEGWVDLDIRKLPGFKEPLEGRNITLGEAQMLINGANFMSFDQIEQ